MANIFPASSDERRRRSRSGARRRADPASSRSERTRRSRSSTFANASLLGAMLSVFRRASTERWYRFRNTFIAVRNK
jgi:hypothetical protein